MQTLPLKVKTLLGFAQKSGVLLSGESAVESAVKRNAAGIVILALDMPEKRRKHWAMRCEARNISLYTLGTKNELGQALGVSERGIIAVTDRQMTAALQKQLSNLDRNA